MRQGIVKVKSGAGAAELKQVESPEICRGLSLGMSRTESSEPKVNERDGGYCHLQSYPELVRRP